MRKKIMILGASELQIPAIECANRLGIETIVLDFDGNAVGRKIASKFYQISTLDYQKVLVTAENEKIDGIMTICSDRPMPIIARIGEKLNLNTISYNTAIKATDKGEMRKALKKNGVPIPQFYVCNSYEEYNRALKKIHGKCIIKPSNNSGSRGIHIYNGNDNKHEIYEYSKKFSTDGVVLVEEYLVGPEISVEVMVINGHVNILQITDKITTGEPYFVEMGHTQPSALSPSVQSDIQEVTSEAVKSIGIENGPAHVEIKITDTGAKIIEIGARLGGDHITTDLVPLSTGINMVELAVKIALNEPINIKKIYNRCAAIRYFNVKPHNLDKIKNNVIKLSIIGKEIKKIASSNDRYGYYIVCEDNIIDLYNKINKIETLIVGGDKHG